MSETVKHTPGPWTAHFNEAGASGATTCSIYDDAHEPDTGYIADVYRNHIGSFIPMEEFEANARLIAAAPDLLKELDVRVGDLFMLRKAIEAGDPKAELLMRVDDMLRETKAAIAKAEGHQ